MRFYTINFGISLALAPETPVSAAGTLVQQVEVFSGNVRSIFTSFLKQGAGFGGSEGIITGRNPHQKRVLGSILETEVP